MQNRNPLKRSLFLTALCHAYDYILRVERAWRPASRAAGPAWSCRPWAASGSLWGAVGGTTSHSLSNLAQNRMKPRVISNGSVTKMGRNGQYTYVQWPINKRVPHSTHTPPIMALIKRKHWARPDAQTCPGDGNQEKQRIKNKLSIYKSFLNTPRLLLLSNIKTANYKMTPKCGVAKLLNGNRKYTERNKIVLQPVNL